jgi:drug/metabolite transporter (DMT)-like permease
MVKPITQRYSSVTIMKWMFLFAALTTAPLFAKDAVSARVFTSEATFDAIWQLVYVVLAATFIAYLLVPIALKNLRPTTVGMYNYLQPVIATVTTIAVGLDVMRWEIPVAAVWVSAGL